MANEDDIVQRIALLGSDEIRKELNALGDDGAKALKRLEEAGGGDLAKGVRQLIPEVAKFDKAMAGAVDTSGKLPGVLGRIGQAFKQLQGISFGQAFQKDADAAAASAAGFAQSLRGIGKDIRTLGRAIDVPGIGQFGRSLGLVSRNIGLIAFPAFIAALGAVANSASQATSQVSDLAAVIGQTPQQFARAASVVIALGGSFEDAGKQLGTFEKNAKDAAASAATAADNVANARDALEGARDAAAQAARPFAQLQQQQINISRAASNGQLTLEQYSQQMQAVREQTIQANEAFIKAEDAVTKAQRALDKARAATTPLEDAFRKVGVTVTDSFVKLPLEEQLKRIAPGFANLGKEVDKAKLAVQLFGDEGRKFVEVLNGGAKGVDAFIKEGERIRPALLNQTKVADDFTKTLGQLQQAIASVKDVLGLAVAPVLTDFFKQLIDLIVENRAAFADFGKALASVVTPFLNGFLVVLKLIGAAITAIAPLFDALARGINALFGSNVTGAQVFLAVIVGLAAAFAPMVPLILLAAAAIAKFVQALSQVNFQPILNGALTLWQTLVAGFNNVVNSIVGFFVAGGQAIVDAWNGMIAFFNDIWNGILAGAVGIWNTITKAFSAGVDFIKSAFFGAIDAVKNIFNDFLNFIRGWVQSGVQFIQGLIDKIKELIGAITGVNQANANANTGTQQSFAQGGAVHGPGTGTSDSIWARVSNGEFVHTARATAHYGLRFMNAVNNLSFPKVPAFSMGGLVDALMPVRSVPRFAEGGAVAAGPTSVINLQMADGTRFSGLTAPAETAQQIVKYATVRAIRKGGSRPSWYGAGK